MKTEYSPGDRINDLEGVEWIVTHTWTYGSWLCLALLKADQPEVCGGTRIGIDDVEGGLVVHRR